MDYPETITYVTGDDKIIILYVFEIRPELATVLSKVFSTDFSVNAILEKIKNANK